MSVLTDPAEAAVTRDTDRPVLGQKIAALRRRQVLVSMAAGFVLLVAVMVAVVTSALFIDWWLELSRSLRFFLLLLHLGVFGFFAVRFVLQPWLRQPDDDELALFVERKQPAFRTRLIAAVQLARPGGVGSGTSQALAHATIAETEAMAQPVHFPELVETRALKQLSLVALGVVVLAAVGLGASGATAFDLLKRALLANVPVPRKTQVLVPEGSRVLGRGDDVTLTAWARGVIPKRGRVELRYSDRRAQSFALDPASTNQAQFSRTIGNVQESFNYVIYLNDGRSKTFQVKALPRPTVGSIECQQEFPAYTGLPPSRRSLGDLALLAGSRLLLQITATKPIRSAHLRLIGSNVTEAIPLLVSAGDPARLSGQLSIPAQGLSGFSIDLADTEGMVSKDSAVYRIDVVPDKPPVVRITYPDRKEELATREAKVIVGMDVADEFKISRLTLRYKVDTMEEGTPRSVELALDGADPKRLVRQFIWNWGTFSPLLPEGSVVEYWVEAEDNNNVTGPGIGSSEHQVARVVSETEKRADLLNRAGDAFSSITDAAADQELLNKRLGAIILEKSGPR